jgi:hypothetical protein
MKPPQASTTGTIATPDSRARAAEFLLTAWTSSVSERSMKGIATPSCFAPRFVLYMNGQLHAMNTDASVPTLSSHISLPRRYAKRLAVAAPTAGMNA